MLVQEHSFSAIRRALPAVLMRAGSSKGLFLHRHHLPPAESDWADILLAAMGSRNADARQIDGVGGATSTTSKVAIVSSSNHPNVDVDYTFVQVAIGTESIDLTGNCGNMASGVGPFALQEGLVKPELGAKTVDVRIFNTNTSRVLVETLQLNPDGSFCEEGPYSIPGVRGSGSEIKVAFVDPAGSMTGRLFPSGNRTDQLSVRVNDQTFFSVKSTLIDVANPFVVIDSASLPPQLATSPKDSPIYLECMEAIRRNGAVKMGLASDIEAAGKVRGTPKLAIVYPAPEQQPSLPGEIKTKKHARIGVSSFSMGKPHPSLQLTGAACLAAAVSIEGTVAHHVAGIGRNQSSLSNAFMTPERTPSPVDEETKWDFAKQEALHGAKTIELVLAGSSLDVDVLATSDEADEVAVNQCVVSRTARRLFEGKVWV